MLVSVFSLINGIIVDQIFVIHSEKMASQLIKESKKIKKKQKK
jgi:hypothetical protein